MFQLFTSGVVDTGANLPPVLLIPATNLPPVSLTPVASLPPVLLIPVVHLDYLHEFSKKFEMTTMLFSGAWGKMIHEKKLKQKSSHDTVPLILIKVHMSCILKNFSSVTKIVFEFHSHSWKIWLTISIILIKPKK